jgi:hypothetical protein
LRNREKKKVERITFSRQNDEGRESNGFRTWAIKPLEQQEPISTVKQEKFSKGRLAGEADSERYES